MKILRMTSLLLLVGIFLGTLQPVLAQRGKEGATGTFFDQYVTPKAKGTKVSGTLAITYVQKELCCSFSTTVEGKEKYDPNDANCIDPQIDRMYYSFRLTTGKVSYPFSSVLTSTSGEYFDTDNPPICFSQGTDRQALAIVDFINDTVIPIIFQQPPVENGFNQVWFIQSINNIMEPNLQLNYNFEKFCCGTDGDDEGNTIDLYEINEFLILDIELAVPK